MCSKFSSIDARSGRKAGLSDIVESALNVGSGDRRDSDRNKCQESSVTSGEVTGSSSPTTKVKRKLVFTFFFFFKSHF